MCLYRQPETALRLPLICFREKRRHVKREIAPVSIFSGVALRFYVFSPADYRLQQTVFLLLELILSAVLPQSDSR